MSGPILIPTRLVSFDSSRKIAAYPYVVKPEANHLNTIPGSELQMRSPSIVRYY